MQLVIPGVDYRVEVQKTSNMIPNRCASNDISSLILVIVDKAESFDRIEAFSSEPLSLSATIAGLVRAYIITCMQRSCVVLRVIPLNAYLLYTYFKAAYATNECLPTWLSDAHKSTWKHAPKQKQNRH